MKFYRDVLYDKLAQSVLKMLEEIKILTAFKEAALWISRQEVLSFYDFFFHGATAPSGPGRAHYRGFTITLRHITLGRNPLDE